MLRALRYSPVVALLLLGACATLPDGPSVLALPGTGKSFDQFRNDDGVCRQYAYEQLGGKTPNQASSESAARSAAVGTVGGAVAGAAIGGRNSAAAGAGTGLLIGSLAGISAADASAYGTQRRYDYSYEQCMYAKGHRIPVSGRFIVKSDHASSPALPPPPPPSAPPR
ncbi:MAG TPA: hypothetical protein VK138_04550 [Acidiferrobacterales bacterium]|nr:hypothetical protein [Acidiferrobacterales bacterium]